MHQGFSSASGFSKGSEAAFADLAHCMRAVKSVRNAAFASSDGKARAGIKEHGTYGVKLYHRDVNK